MIDLLPSPFISKFQNFMESIEEKCLICSPYITLGPVRRLVNTVEAKGVENNVSIKVITDISAGNLVQGSTDTQALIFLLQRIPNSEVIYLPRIHAKIYVSGESRAIISSANFTDGGTYTNLEYGVQITEPSLVRQVLGDAEQYAKLGASVSLKQLSELHERVNRLRSVIQEEQKSINKKLRAVSVELQRNTEDDLIRIRVKGRTTHAIFAETILYLISNRPLTTVELNERIKEIHPDLCDDNIDRVIDGKHFGKFWKHEVRTAQKYLKRKGVVSYDADTRLWKRIV